MYSLKRGQLVEVRWLDSAAGSNWRDVDEITEFVHHECRSVGWVLVPDDDDGFVLTASYLDENGPSSILLQQHIPWGCVIPGSLIVIE